MPRLEDTGDFNGIGVFVPNDLSKKRTVESKLLCEALDLSTKLKSTDELDNKINEFSEVKSMPVLQEGSVEQKPIILKRKRGRPRKYNPEISSTKVTSTVDVHAKVPKKKVLKKMK